MQQKISFQKSKWYIENVDYSVFEEARHNISPRSEPPNIPFCDDTGIYFLIRDRADRIIASLSVDSLRNIDECGVYYYDFIINSFELERNPSQLTPHCGIKMLVAIAKFLAKDYISTNTENRVYLLTKNPEIAKVLDQCNVWENQISYSDVLAWVLTEYGTSSILYKSLVVSGNCELVYPQYDLYSL